MTPLKWKKFELLVLSGLMTQEDLEEQVRRYGVADYEIFFSDIATSMELDNYKSNYVGICVTPRGCFNLPNFKMRTPKDIDEAKIKLDELGHKNFVELWYVQNSTSEAENIFGRKCIWIGDSYMPSLVEVAKGVSSRVLNDPSNIIETPNKIKSKLHSYRNQISDLGLFLRSADCKELCVEFKVVNNKFSFYDWHAGDDVAILNKLEEGGISLG